jgi:2-polyprenyl-3-methyl-5-hydroxy-6-metoxy-1,4-benzoquinol methylase
MSQNIKAPVWVEDQEESFINFKNPYNTTVSIIIITTGLAILIFIFRKISKKKYEYHSQEYWESRYSIFPKNMDWYCNFQKICTDFKIDEILETFYPNKNKAKILELGCGNSSLSYDLHYLGYRNISAIDFSSLIINQMKEKHKTTSINCKT